MVATQEIIEQTISVYQRAAAANRSTAGRQGNLVVVDAEAADEVMVTADLHGHRWNFERLLAIADLEHHPRRQLVMQEVCHGGPSYPATSGCMSHLLLEDMARLKTEFDDRFHFILGNHELAELIDFPITKANRMLNLTFRCGLQEMYGRAAERVRDAALQFIQSSPLAVRMSNGVFICHSAPDRVAEEGFDVNVFCRPLTLDDLAPYGPVFRLVWGRDFRHQNAAAFARLVKANVLIHGHEPCPDGYRVPNDCQVILDSCCQAPSYVILPTNGKLTLQQTIDLVRRIS